MPRKAFIADLAEAYSSFRRNNISDIKAGEDDGQVTFTYKNHDSSTDVVALVPGMYGFLSSLSSFNKGFWALQLVSVASRGLEELRFNFVLLDF